MLDTISRFVGNLFYLVPIKIKQFNKENPGIEIIAAGATKARKMEANSDPSYELGWVTARRSTLILSSEGLYCGDWFIPLADIQEAIATRISGGLVLKVSAKDGTHYQFGLQNDPLWEKQTILPLEIERTELKFSVASLVLRLGVVLFLISLIIRDFTQEGVDIITVIYLFFFIWFGLPLVRRIMLKATI